MKYISSLGAIPEKIRLDGYPIGYWYSTPHGLFVWAAVAALANMGPNGELRLLWGLDGTWKDLSFRTLRLPGSILVSASVEKGEIRSLEISNESGAPLALSPDINPLYDHAGIPRHISLESGGKFTWSR